jgi:SAM-dependent methyltransferase
VERAAYERFFELDQRHFWRIAKRRLVLDSIRSRIPFHAPIRALDIGSACSLTACELKQFAEVTVVEPDRDSVRFAREVLRLDARQGSLPDELPVRGPFHVITLLDCLEHVREDEAALKRIRDLLAPGGLFICTVPALKVLWSAHDIALGHFRRYHKRELLCLLAEAGFFVERATYYTSLLLPVLAYLRLADRLRRRAAPAYEVRVPRQSVNLACGLVMQLEYLLLRFMNLPLGSSLLAICRKP